MADLALALQTNILVLLLSSSLFIKVPPRMRQACTRTARQRTPVTLLTLERARREQGVFNPGSVAAFSGSLLLMIISSSLSVFIKTGVSLLLNCISKRIHADPS